MWIYKGKEFCDDQIEDHVGFIYIIENLTNHRKYVGKKLGYDTTKRNTGGKGQRTIIETEANLRVHQTKTHRCMISIIPVEKLVVLLWVEKAKPH